jgi:hypothetical protein
LRAVLAAVGGLERPELEAREFDDPGHVEVGAVDRPALVALDFADDLRFVRSGIGFERGDAVFGLRLVRVHVVIDGAEQGKERARSDARAADLERGRKCPGPSEVLA